MPGTGEKTGSDGEHAADYAADSEGISYPVDIEFTINLSDNGEYSINLLQCRPLQVFKDTGKVEIPSDIPEESIILENVKSSMGLSRVVPLDVIVYIEPVAYYNMPYKNKYKVAIL